MENVIGIEFYTLIFTYFKIFFILMLDIQEMYRYMYNKFNEFVIHPDL